MTDRDPVITGIGRVEVRDQPAGAVEARLRGFLPGDTLRRLSRYTALALAALKEAVDAAGLMPGDRTGVLIATTWGPIDCTLRYYRDLIAGGPRQVSPLLFPNTAASTALGWVARIFAARGPSCVMSGGNPVEQACQWVLAGRVESLLLGEVEVGAPAGPGEVDFSQGAAAGLVIEAAGHARRRSARAVARVLESTCRAGDAGVAAAGDDEPRRRVEAPFTSHCLEVTRAVAALGTRGRGEGRDPAVVATFDPIGGMWSGTVLGGLP
jgi:3-oxoacyl-(acyl-carrier-protein) synthase